MSGVEWRLLAEGDPAPVRVLRPEGRSDFLLAGDHAGRAIPQRLGTLGLSNSERARHIAWDIGIAGVTECLSESLDATAVLQSYSRLVIDCNRDPNVPSSIPEISETTEIPGKSNSLSRPCGTHILAKFASALRGYRQLIPPTFGSSTECTLSGHALQTQNCQNKSVSLRDTK